jgi:hypothetical protein
MLGRVTLVTDMLKVSYYSSRLWPLHGVLVEAGVPPEVKTTTTSASPQNIVNRPPPRRLTMEDNRASTDHTMITTTILRLLVALNPFVCRRERDTRAMMLTILALSRRAKPREQKTEDGMTAITVKALVTRRCCRRPDPMSTQISHLLSTREVRNSTMTGVGTPQMTCFLTENTLTQSRNRTMASI